jgi:hypothetical protein
MERIAVAPSANGQFSELNIEIFAKYCLPCGSGILKLRVSVIRRVFIRLMSLILW